MKINVDDKAKIVTLWLSNKENIENDVPLKVKEEIDEYKERKYKVCIYQSGNEDIRKNLLNLIINNVR